KVALIAPLARWFGQPWGYAIATGLCLAQIGEFSFVLATIAQTPVDGAALMQPPTFRVMVSATILSLLLTPYLIAVAPRLGMGIARVLGLGAPAGPGDDETRADTAESILIVGFGPAGQRVAEGLLARKQTGLIVVDLNQKNVALAQSYGLKGLWGDATQTDVLEHAGVRDASVAVVTLPDHAATRQLIALVRDLSPDTRVIVRCRYHMRHWELLAAGAHEVVDEEDHVGRELARQVAHALSSD
ncbi:MAG: NAD-binding protein, partial [Planctomycetota bacterium]